jgi:hypothetical protein
LELAQIAAAVADRELGHFFVTCFFSRHAFKLTGGS